MPQTNTWGGGVDQTAVIGHAPEHRDWTPDMPAYDPLLGDAVRIEAFVTIDAGVNRNTTIGHRTWLMKHVHVGHDAIVGDDCELAPGVVVGGHCEIGDRVKIGINACLKPGVTVGDETRIGAGAVVVHNVPPGITVAGNPARPIRHRLLPSPSRPAVESMPMLTVLIPTLGRDTLERAVDSVKTQTVPCEVIVEYDPTRTGAGPTLNRMLPHVRTPWVATMGDDDELDPRYAELLAAQDQTLDLVIFQMRYQDGRVLPTHTEPAHLAFGGVGCSYAVKTEVARRIGWIREPCHSLLAEDWEMIRTVREMGGNIRIVPQVTYYVRPR